MPSMLWAIVRSPEFWASGSRRAKIKSPFELAASSVRSLHADVYNPRRLVEWIDKMGQPLYRYQAPTGFPDHAETWVNAGSLLHRMNFGMTLAADNVRGVYVDLAALQGGSEPESSSAALVAYANILLPGRDVDATVEVLLPLVTEPDVAKEIRERSDAMDDTDGAGDGMAMDDEPAFEPPPDDETALPEPDRLPDAGASMSLAQVVGLILGSPEFQRR